RRCCRSRDAMPRRPRPTLVPYTTLFRSRGLPRFAGHRQGIESLREITRACGELGIEILTVYAFSTENWERPKEEVNFLLNLLDEVLDRELPELHANGVRVRIIGRRSSLPPSLVEKIEAAE